MIRGLATAIAAAALLTAPGAHATAAEDTITVKRAWARAMPGGSDVGAGYVVIRNSGDASIRLVSATSARAQSVEIHETTMVDDVMRMRPVTDGVDISPGETLEMRPGGMHIMFLGVDEPFAEGEEVPASLVFEPAGERAIVFEVEGRHGQAPYGGANHHGDGSHHDRHD